MQKMVFYHENQTACSCVLALTVQSLSQIGRFPQAGPRFCGQERLLDALRAFPMRTGRAATIPFPKLQGSYGYKSRMLIKVMRGISRRVSGGTTANCSFFKCPPPPTPPPTDDYKAIWAPLLANSLEYT